MADQYVPIEEIAKQFSVSASTIRSWVRQGIIPRDTYMKIGATYRFNVPKIVEHFTTSPDEEITPEAEPVLPETTEPVQLVLDFGNPDEDL